MTNEGVIFDNTRNMEKNENKIKWRQDDEERDLSFHPSEKENESFQTLRSQQADPDRNVNENSSDAIPYRQGTKKLEY